jgi:hypothetical protein
MVVADVGRNAGMLKKTAVTLTKMTTIILAVQPTAEGSLKLRHFGRYFGLRLRYIRRATGIKKEISCNTIEEPINALKAGAGSC